MSELNNALETLAKEIAELHQTVVGSPPSVRKKARYRLGEVLIEMEPLIPSEQAFEHAVREVLKANGDDRIPSVRAIQSYRKVAEFTDYETYNTLGSTQVNQLLKEENVEIREKVQEKLEEGQSPAEIKRFVKEELFEASVKKQQDIAELMDEAVDADLPQVESSESADSTVNLTDENVSTESTEIHSIDDIKIDVAAIKEEFTQAAEEAERASAEQSVVEMVAESELDQIEVAANLLNTIDVTMLAERLKGTPTGLALIAALNK